jgi:5'-3' exonuclease
VLNRVEAITAQLGLLEDDVFRERADMSERQERGRERRKQQDLERKKRAEAHHAINASANKVCRSYCSANVIRGVAGR